MRSSWLFALLLAGCGPAPIKPPDCHYLCSPLAWSKLDLVAGRPGGVGAADAVGAEAHFIAPWNGGIDGIGHLYLADGNMIRAIDLATAGVTTLAGTLDVNNGSYDGIGVNASFNTPSGVGATPTTVYVTDTENHTLRAVDVATQQVTTIAGSYATAGSTDGTGAAALFKEPEGLAINKAGTALFIADTDNHIIRRVDLPQAQVTTLAGTALQRGTTDAMGAAARFNVPKAVTLDDAEQNLYIVDSANMSIRKLALADNTVTTVATLPGLPQGLAVDGASLLVSTGNTIIRVDIATGAMTPVVGGASGFVDGTGAAALLDSPAGLISDRAGTVYVADTNNYALRKLTPQTATLASFAGSNPVGSQNGTGTDARFDAISGLAAGGGIIYVADTANEVVRRVVAATGEVTTLAGGDGQSGTADGAGTDARFTSPAGLALDGAGHLYVADRDNRRVRVIDVATGQVTSLTLTPSTGFTFLSSPESLALDGNHLFVSDSGNHVVIALDLTTGLATGLAGTPSTPGSSDGTGAKARFNSPGGLAADGAGHLFVADVLNNSVRQIVISTGVVTTLAGGIIGTDDGVGPLARFHYPTELAATGGGELFVGDSLNRTVRRIQIATGAVTTVVGNPKRFGVQLGPLPAQIGLPGALALTDEGYLAIATECSVLLAR